MQEETMSDDKPKSLVNVELSVPGAELDKAASGLLTRILGYPAMEASQLLGDLIGLVGDPIRMRRQVNSMTVVARAWKDLEDRGISLEQVVPLGIPTIDRILNGGSDADEPEIQKLWAGLLSSSVDPEKRLAVRPAIVKALSEMDGLDARALLVVISGPLRLQAFSNSQTPSLEEFHRITSGLSGDDLAAYLKNTSETQNRIVEAFFSKEHRWLEEGLTRVSTTALEATKQNLLRLGLIKLKQEFEPRPPKFNFNSRRERTDDEIENALKALLKYQQDLSSMNQTGGVNSYTPLVHYNPARLQYPYELTSFGKELAEACRIDPDID